MNDEKMWTKEEVAVKWRCSVDKVERNIKSGAIDAVKIGRRVLIPEAAVQRWLAPRSAKPAGAAA